MESSEYLMVYNTCPDQAVAEKIATELVQQKLAACVNIVAGMQSIYHWQGKLEKSAEVLLLIKTRREVYPQMESFIVENHPYELPEIVAVPIMQGLPGYLGWIDQEIKSI